MLSKLSIKNFAIIENAEVDFKKGFTVLTGGTGAGKSLIIDSLSLLLGERANSEMIRSGEEKATISGEFILNNTRAEAVLLQLEIPFPDHKVTIERTISKSRNQVKANGVPLSLQDLNLISKYIADIHNQFDFAKLLDENNYLDIIDGFSYEKTSRYKADYLKALSEFHQAKEEYDELVKKKQKLDENYDFLRYQLDELTHAELKENEEEEVHSEITLLKNSDKIYELIQSIKEVTDSDFLTHFHDLNKSLNKLAELQPNYKENYEKLDSFYYEMEDTFEELSKKFRALDFDPERLDELLARESTLESLKRKYHKSIEELIATRNELEQMLTNKTSFQEEILAKKAEMDQHLHLAFLKGKELSEIRKAIAKSIEKEIKNNLKDLLLKAEFEVAFRPFASEEDVTFSDNGIDQVDFLIETNVGEGLKPLSKIVSGGEASRIMLAFKTVFVKANKIETIIFDEIDTGISGVAAEATAKKMKEISYYSQVIAITHMPQIAALSDVSVHIEKMVKEGRTYTTIKELTLEEKIREIAQMISGGKVTEKQLEYARELVLGDH